MSQCHSCVDFTHFNSKLFTRRTTLRAITVGRFHQTKNSSKNSIVFGRAMRDRVTESLEVNHPYYFIRQVSVSSTDDWLRWGRTCWLTLCAMLRCCEWFSVAAAVSQVSTGHAAGRQLLQMSRGFSSWDDAASSSSIVNVASSSSSSSAANEVDGRRYEAACLRLHHTAVRPAYLTKSPNVSGDNTARPARWKPSSSLAERARPPYPTMSVRRPSLNDMYYGVVASSGGGGAVHRSLPGACVACDYIRHSVTTQQRLRYEPYSASRRHHDKPPPTTGFTEPRRLTYY